MIDLSPESANSSLDRGRAYLGFEEPEQAIADFTTGIRLRPDYSLLYRDRGKAYESLEDIEKAVADYEEYMRLAVSNDPAKEQVLNRLKTLKSEND